MDPPGEIASQIKQQPQQKQQKPPPPPQPFEIALVRKLESKTTSVRGAFLLLDIDGDGRISPTDVRTVLHNELGLDLTTEQEHCLFSRSGQFKKNHHNNNNESSSNNNNDGMGYADFAKYFQEVSSAPFPASQSGLAAAVGFHRNDTGNTASDNTNGNNIDHEMPIHLQPQTIILQRRHQLRQLLSSHSSPEGRGNSGMKETSLFLNMDVHRSGKVTMQEFLVWLNTVGMLQWTIEDLKQVVLNREESSDVIMESEKLEMRWFGNAGDDDGDREGGEEAGMTEHDFAEFVESLDGE
ncbi:hypothetical protein ACHAXR_007959 [Thalassiosira sp. AJA248-18]